MNQNQFYEQLVRRYLDDKLSDDELEVLLDLVQKNKLQPYFEQALQQHGQPFPVEKRNEKAKVFVLSRRRKIFLSAAVLIGLMAMAGVWYADKRPRKKLLMAAAQHSGDKAPGRNHALLTLYSGRVIDLDSGSAAEFHLQGATRLVKNGKGEWSYLPDANDSTSGIYNTLSAPRGGQFSFVLGDGTHVWLNAASSLQFPASFSGSKRKVILTGEAYFEVAPDTHAPFLVDARYTQVEVLGTHFNVNAYADESAVTTTLLEGSVKVAAAPKQKAGDQATVPAATLLHPGEQARLRIGGAIDVEKQPAAIEAAIAWKEGFFSFEEADIHTVMRQIARWYDVQVRYEGPVTPAVFGGDIGRDLTLMQVLKVLEKSQVHFRLEGSVLTVLP